MNILLDIFKFVGVMLPLGLPIALVIFLFVKNRKMKREKEERARIRTEESIARKEKQQKWASRNTDYTKLENRLHVKSYLYSDRGIDYSRLRDFLAAKQFKEANSLTLLHIKSAMVVGSGFRSDFHWQDYQRVPGRDLVTIDRLWSQFSEGRFGFGVQVQLWQQGDRCLTHLREKLGWHESVYLKKHVDEMQCHDYGTLGRWLQSKAPQGHLPNLFFCHWYTAKEERYCDGRDDAIPACLSGKIIYTNKVTKILDDWGSGGNGPIEVINEEHAYEEIDAFSIFMIGVKEALDRAL